MIGEPNSRDQLKIFIKSMMFSALNAYLVAWISFVAILLMRIAIKREDVSIISKRYFAFISRTWRLLAFFVATAILIQFSRIANDPTWDFFSSSIMASLTFLTAPYSVAKISRVILKLEKLSFETIVVFTKRFPHSRTGTVSRLWFVQSFPYLINSVT